MRYLYYCTTPFQVLSALNMCYNSVLGYSHANDSIDIVIVDIFSDAKSISIKLKSTGLFKRVYLIKEEPHKKYSNKYIKLFLISSSIFFPTTLIKRQFKCKPLKTFYKKYDYIISSVFSHTIAALRTLNRKAIYIMMDDGIASYFGDWTKRIRSNGYLRLLKLRNFGHDIVTPSSLYVMRKNMCKSEVTNTIHQLPEFSEGFLKTAFFVFDMSSSMVEYDKDIIWLTHVSNTNEKREGTYKISNVLNKYSTNVIARRHPREKEVIPYEHFYLDEEKGMWELKLSNISMNDKLIVTLSSTGAFTPKFLYNEEPWLLFAYKLIPLPNGSQIDDFRTIVQQLKNSYTHPEHIFEPDSWEEFDKSINSFLSRND